MKKYFMLLINTVALIGLIVYSLNVNQRLSDLEFQCNAAVNEFAELDKRYFSKLENISGEIEKDLNAPEFKQFPDSIRLKLNQQKRFGSYFYDYKGNIEWALAEIKTNLEEQLLAIRLLAVIAGFSFLVNGLHLFFRASQSQRPQG